MTVVLNNKDNKVLQLTFNKSDAETPLSSKEKQKLWDSSYDEIQMITPAKYLVV
jgi:hypothetical protein